VRTLLAGALLLFAVAMSPVHSPRNEPEVTRTERTVPSCEEDAVIVGTGDFEHGRWTSYVCGPSADHFGPIVIEIGS
jgi:hypothetical protein